jgi:hypothetical protein
MKEVRAMDIDNITPEEAKCKLRFYQRVRAQMLFESRKSAERHKRFSAAENNHS